MNPALLTDFDDTAAEQNVAEMLLHRFGDGSWQDVRAEFRAGRISLKDYQEVAFNNIRADRDVMKDYVRANASLRPWFSEVWNHCLEREIPMAIVSQGLDFYIEALLEKAGCPQIPIYAVETDFTAAGIAYKYNFTYPEEPHRGNSKGLVVNQFQQQGYHVVFAGDGRSDFEAAQVADEVFAHSILAEECQRQGIPFRPFTDFGDVLSLLRNFS